MFPFHQAAALSHATALPQQSAAAGRPFLSYVTAQQRGERSLSALTASTAPPGVILSGARLMSEPARAQLRARWRSPETARSAVVVREGQSLWDIAAAWGVSVDAIAGANALANIDYIKPGQHLVIPSAGFPVRAPAVAGARTTARARATVRAAAIRPFVVVVREGQTLWTLSTAHRVSVDSIAQANGLRDADMIRAGQRLVIPGLRAAAVRPLGRMMTVRVTAQRAEAAVTTAALVSARIARGFLWPARGRLTSRFGWRRWRHHDGLDIAAPRGSPIYAARPGLVIYAGWYYSYGLAVILDHGNGLETLYGHASALLVRPGQVVTQGELIARVGSTGRSTGPHVHFEVRVNGKAVNPMKYMD